MVTQALRGYGPRVFISYSFADAELARRLDVTLVAKGFQVRREDEASLFNEKLTEAIPRRIADSEVFVQLLTTAANRSMWVSRELDCLFELRKAGTAVMLLPIVFDKSTIPEGLKDWWYMDVSSSGLTDATLDAIVRFCLKSVHPLRLADDDPLSVASDDLQTALTEVPKDGRRIILDSDGKLFGWAKETIDFAEQLKSEHGEGFLVQEKDRLDRLIRRLKIRDEVIRRLVLELMPAMEKYTNEPLKDAVRPMNHFLRIILSDLVARAADVAPPEPHPLRTVFKDRIAAARDANSPNDGPGYLNPGLYAWIFGEKGGAEAMCLMDMVAPGFESVKVQLPRAIFGDMVDVYTRSAIPFDPRSELLDGTFLNYVMPQIAVHSAYNLVDPGTVRTDLEQKYAWRLERYTKMGMA